MTLAVKLQVISSCLTATWLGAHPSKLAYGPHGVLVLNKVVLFEEATIESL
jgi:hypothetical protein